MGPKYTETGILYMQSQLKDGTGNLLPDLERIVFSGLKCNIHRGGTDAKNDAAAAGFEVDKAAIGYCSIAYREWIRNNLILTTRPKEFWKISAEPDFRDRFPRTAHCRFLLQLLTQAPRTA